MVYHHGVRPLFPPGAPGDLVALAHDCWRTDPTQRPTFHKIAARLAQMLRNVEAAAAGLRLP